VDNEKQIVIKLTGEQLVTYSSFQGHLNVNKYIIIFCKEYMHCCSTSDTHRVNLVTKPVIIHEWGKDWKVFTTSETYPWPFVTQIFHRINQVHDGLNIKTELQHRLKIIGDKTLGEYNLQISDLTEDDLGSYWCERHVNDGVIKKQVVITLTGVNVHHVVSLIDLFSIQIRFRKNRRGNQE
jgi:hypothetical protein